MTYYREERRPPQDAESLFECDLQSSMGRETVVYPHVHDYFEALYCLSGGYELYVSGAEHPFSAGDLVLIDPNEVHHTLHRRVESIPRGQVHAGGAAVCRAPGI